MVFLEVERQQNLLIPPDHPKWGYDPSLMNISTTRKSSNEHGFFIDVTSGVKIVKGESKTLQVITCKRNIPTTISPAILTLTMPCQEA